MKKCLIFLIVLTLTLCTGVAFAESAGTCGANLSWKLDASGTLTISGSGVMDDCKYGSAPWKDQSSKIKSVVIDDGVTTIGDSAFSWCRELTSVTLPDSLTIISDSAFENCYKLTTIVMSKNVESIGSWSFYGCDSLIAIELPETLKRIEDLAFNGCESLSVLNIPASVEYINEDRTFAGANKLMAINVAEGNSYYVSVDGILFNKDKTTLLVYPAGKASRSYTVPDTVTKINAYAFYWNELIESITVPGTVENIGGDAFAGCENLASISLSEGLFSIGSTAFHQCRALSTITFPASLEKLGDDMFESCYELKEILVADESTYFKSIDSVLFDYSGRTLVAYPAGKLQGTYTVPDGVEAIGDYAFLYAKNLVNVVFPDSLLTIGSSSFSGCDKLTGIILPENLVSLDFHAFNSCDGLTSIVIPASVISLGDGAFSWCDRLMVVTIKGMYTSFNKWGVFKYCDEGLTIKGLPGSTAEQMARDEGLKFEAETFEEEVSNNSDDWACPKCATVNHGGKFCGECGSKRPESQICSNCGYENMDLNHPFKFCPECGTKFEW